MGGSKPDGCECGSGACGCTARAADGYGYDGTAGNDGTDAVGAGGHVCAGTDGDDGGAFGISTTIRSGCNELSIINNTAPEVSARPRQRPWLSDRRRPPWARRKDRKVVLT